MHHRGANEKQENCHARGTTSRKVVELYATAIDILEAAKKKHAAYNKRFRAGEYRLVYKDGSDVDVIPGTDEPFSLRRYKEESGFGYARINLFLLPASSIFDELQESLQETDSDLGDDLDGLEPDADHQELLQPV